MFYIDLKLVTDIIRSLVKIHKWCVDGYHTEKTVFVVTIATFIFFGIIGLITGYTPILLISTVSIGAIYLLVIIPLSPYFCSFLHYNQTRK